ncbi:hypothetical protein H0W26_02220 [Candidatus Dependentiae bacterium]|nr:hypothetical protein [Candidatus Dependentiae bacterium]
MNRYILLFFTLYSILVPTRAFYATEPTPLPVTAPGKTDNKTEIAVQPAAKKTSSETTGKEKKTGTQTVPSQPTSSVKADNKTETTIHSSPTKPASSGKKDTEKKTATPVTPVQDSSGKLDKKEKSIKPPIDQAVSTVKQEGPIKTFTKDGSLGAFRPSLGDKGPVVVELATAKPRFTLEEKKASPELFTASVLAFNPQGTLLAAASDAYTVRIWDTQTGKELTPLKGHTGHIKALVFNPKGEIIASGSSDHTARLWDIKTGKEQVQLKGHTDSVNTLVFTRDGANVVTGSTDRTIRLWDTKSGVQLSLIDTYSWPIYEIALSPLEDMLAVVSLSPLPGARLIDFSSGKKLHSLRGHSKFIRSLAFNADGTKLATGSEDTTIKIWDIKTMKEYLTLTGHTEELIKVAFGPQDTTLFSSAYDNTFRTWNTSLAKAESNVSHNQPHTKPGNSPKEKKPSKNSSTATGMPTVTVTPT